MTLATAQALPLALVGCDFRVASARWRSLLVQDEAEVARLAQDLQRGGWAHGLLELSTCNRNEWLVVSSNPTWAGELLRCRMLDRIRERSQSPPPPLQPYVLLGEDAARHLFRVAIGQESLVAGERQISGQLFRSIEAARRLGTSHRMINGLGSIAGRLVRIATRRGLLGGSARGVHALAVGYLRRELQGLSKRRVVVLGLGDIGRRVLGLLEADNHFVPLPCNRTVAPADRPRVRDLSELPALLAEADACVVCTGAPQPILGPELLAQRPAGKPLLVVDIGIPEQVDHEALPAGVRWAGLDELRSFHEAQQDPREAGRREGAADALVERAVEELQRYRHEPTFAEVLRLVRGRQRSLTETVLPGLLEGRLAQLDPELRGAVEQDLRGVLQGYGQEIFRSIREASRRLAEGETWPDEL